MDTAAIIELVATILTKVAQAAPTVIASVEQAMPLASELVNIIKGDTVTDDQKAQIEAMVDQLFATSQQPLSPAQPGDPDYQA